MADEELKPDTIKPDNDASIQVSSSDLPEPKAEETPKAKEEPTLLPKDKEDEPESKDDPEKKPEDDPEQVKAAEVAAAKAREKEDWDNLPNGAQKRISRQSRQINDLKGENAALEARIDALEAPSDDPEPKAEELDPDSFDSWDEYLDARDKAGVKKEEPKPEPKAEKSEPLTGTVPPEDFFKAQGDLGEKVSAKDPDLWDKISDTKHPDFVNLSISPELVVSLSELDDPANVIEKLIETPDKAAKFSKMSVFQQARALAKLDAEEPPKQRIKSEAPEPIEPVASRSRPVDRPFDELSQSEFEERRNAEETARGGAGAFR